MTEPLVITNSELRTWELCKRKWWLSWYHGYTTDPSSEPAAGVMHLGSSVHLALEAYYSYDINPILALQWIYKRDIDDHPSAEDRETLEKELQMAEVMVTGYVEWVAAEGIDASVDIIGTEVAIRHERTINGTSVILQGRLDQLARRKSDSALIARDLKTVGTLSRSQELRLSSQLKFYALIQALEAKAGSGETVAGGEYLLLLRSKRTIRATPPFYTRVEVPLNRHDLNAEYQKTLAIVRDIIQAREILDNNWQDHHSVVYPHPGDWCSWQCPFKDVCPLFDDGSRAMDMMQAHFIKKDAYSYYSSGTLELLKAALTGS
jgi:predicted thioesterase